MLSATEIPGRAELLADAQLLGREFTDRYTAVIERWLVDLYDEVIGAAAGCALVAVGGQGRSELSPASDLDLILLVDGAFDTDLAQQLWYPMWDQKLKVGHSVRTVKDSLKLALEDLPTATSLLSARHLAGDESLTNALAEQATKQWAKGWKKYSVKLSEAVSTRHKQSGEVAFDLEPELKEGRGGLRDVHALRWAAAASREVEPSDLDALDASYDTLLAARVELHRSTGRNGDTLLLQEQDAVATRLGYGDADALMADIAGAARSIAWVSDETWFRLNRKGGRVRLGRKATSVGEHLSIVDGEVQRDPDVPSDVYTVLRVAVAAADAEARISRELQEVLADAPYPTDDWDETSRALFVRLLGAGRPAITTIETLDHLGVWCRIFPEWEHTRSRPQRNAYHTYTVDRHLLETVANASALTGQVDRPDLLLLGALLHDIGKGRPGDHSQVGREMAATICGRMGYSQSDIETVQLLVEHHLLLPDVATRRDIDDPATLRLVADRVPTRSALYLLAALTEADSLATGPSAWGSWKAGLVSTLTARTADVLAGTAPDDLTNDEMSAAARKLFDRFTPGDPPIIEGSGDTLRLVCDDRAGTFAKAAAVLSLNGLNVLSAFAGGTDGVIVDEFRVTSVLDIAIDWEAVTSDLVRALRGRLALESRLAARSQSYSSPNVIHELEPLVRCLNEASDEATVIEVIGPDSMGLLYRLARSLSGLELNICSAKVTTMGSDVVDVFYVTESDGSKILDEVDLGEIRTELSHVLELDPSELA